MKLGNTIEKLNDIYYEEGDITLIVETNPGEYKRVDFINVIANERNKKFVVLS